eukprot:2391587-Pleurochrysis_carterae.AAC.2
MRFETVPDLANVQLPMRHPSLCSAFDHHSTNCCTFHSGVGIFILTVVAACAVYTPHPLLLEQIEWLSLRHPVQSCVFA